MDRLSKLSRLNEIFPLALPSSAELEEAAQELERRADFWLSPAKHGVEEAPDPDRAALYLMAAAAYRQVYEERQTREALRALLVAGDRRRRWQFGAR